MFKCVFPVLLVNMSIHGLSLKDLSKTIGRSPDALRKKLSGNTQFDIEEAMKINEKLFPNIPFKELFSKANSFNITN